MTCDHVLSRYASMSSRRDAVPFDTRYFEKLTATGEVASSDAIFRDIYRRCPRPI